MELEFIRWLREHVPADPRASSACAMMRRYSRVAGNPDIVVTTDLLTDGVDFRVGTDDLRRIGRQALGANLSDLAAMAAKPLAAFISVALPHSGPAGSAPLELAIGLYEGMLPLAREFDIAIAGGDTNTYDGPLVISVTAIGQPTKVRRAHTLRRPARRLAAGDRLARRQPPRPHVRLHAASPRSDSACTSDTNWPPGSISATDSRSTHRDSPRQAAAARDLHWIGAGFAGRDRASQARWSEQPRQQQPSQHALGDGQDFELLFAVNPTKAKQSCAIDRVDCQITHVGELIAEPGLWQQQADGRRSPLEATGWRHNNDSDSGLR